MSKAIPDSRYTDSLLERLQLQQDQYNERQDRQRQAVAEHSHSDLPTSISYPDSTVVDELTELMTLIHTLALAELANPGSDYVLKQHSAAVVIGDYSYTDMHDSREPDWSWWLEAGLERLYDTEKIGVGSEALELLAEHVIMTSFLAGGNPNDSKEYYNGCIYYSVALKKLWIEGCYAVEDKNSLDVSELVQEGGVVSGAPMQAAS